MLYPVSHAFKREDWGGSGWSQKNQLILKILGVNRWATLTHHQQAALEVCTRNMSVSLEAFLALTLEKSSWRMIGSLASWSTTGHESKRGRLEGEFPARNDNKLSKNSYSQSSSLSSTLPGLCYLADHRQGHLEGYIRSELFTCILEQGLDAEATALCLNSLQPFH